MIADKMSKRTLLWSSFIIFLLSATLVATLMTSISAAPPTHDVAVTKITLSYNTTAVFPTWENPLNITVTVKNNGSSKETFDLTAYYYNETQWDSIQTKTVEDLVKGTERNETFTWDCRDLSGYPDDPDLAWPYPVYEIKANATLTNDDNPEDNELINGDVTVQWPGDCDGDGHVNDDDMTIIQVAFFAQFPDPNYDPRADFNGDGSITGVDMVIWGIWEHRGPLDHNVAVINITFSYDTTVVYPTWNEPLEIYVEVKNKGSAYNENFTVTVYNGTTPIGTQDITDLEPGSEQTKNFSWTIPIWAEYPDNRTGAWPYPNHTIKANATLANDVHQDDNVYSRNVTVQWPGDCDGDGHVNDDDMTIIQVAFFAQFPDPNYDPRADFNGDGSITGVDMVIWGIWEHRGPLDHCDVDVTSMTFSYNTQLVYPTWENPLQIYVTVKNKGTNTENIQVTFYCKATAIDTKELNLTPGDEETLTFTWNIPNATYPYLNYTLNATAALPCDENLTNNGRNSTVTVQWPGDCDGDGHVNATDLLSPYYRDDLDVYNPRSDFNGDGLVDTEDVKILIDNWETGPLD